jgi:hypothetical protein
LDEVNSVNIEMSLMSSEALYQEVQIVEDELTDQYLANELPEADRQSYESHFLAAPERHQKLRFARALKRYVGQAGESSLQDARALSVQTDERPVRLTTKKGWLFSLLPLQNPIPRYALAAAALIVVIGIGWVAFNAFGPAPRTSGKVFLVNLSPGLSRDSGQTISFAIPADTDSIQLKLDLPSGDYPAYRAELLTVELSSLLVEEGLRPEATAGNKTINFVIPAGFLKRNDYRVKVSGRTGDGNYEDVASYVFRVVG